MSIDNLDRWDFAIDEAAESIQQTISECRELAREHEDSARRLHKRARWIAQEVLAGRWFNLEGVLTDEQIEALCQCEPSDRSVMLRPFV